MIEAWAISLSCGLDDRATPCPTHVNLRSWLIYRTGFLSSHWPDSGVVGHSRGGRVGGSLSLPHDLLWVVPFLGVLRITGRRTVQLLARTPGGLESSP
jgi:hypothetical protein